MCILYFMLGTHHENLYLYYFDLSYVSKPIKLYFILNLKLLLIKRMTGNIKYYDWFFSTLPITIKMNHLQKNGHKNLT